MFALCVLIMFFVPAPYLSSPWILVSGAVIAVAAAVRFRKQVKGGAAASDGKSHGYPPLWMTIAFLIFGAAWFFMSDRIFSLVPVAPKLRENLTVLIFLLCMTLGLTGLAAWIMRRVSSLRDK